MNKSIMFCIVLLRAACASKSLLNQQLTSANDTVTSVVRGEQWTQYLMMY